MKSFNLFPLLFVFAACNSGTPKYDATGTFEATEVIVSAEASGKLLSLDIEEGTLLKAGEEVGIIDTVQLYLKKLQLETIPIDSLSESSLYQRSNIYVLEDDSLEKLAMKELTHAINVSLTKLPPRTREIFILSRFSGLKNKEIADQLGLTTKGIEYHIGNALKQLRNDLSKDYFAIFYCLLLSLLIKK